MQTSAGVAGALALLAALLCCVDGGEERLIPTGPSTSASGQWTKTKTFPDKESLALGMYVVAAPPLLRC